MSLTEKRQSSIVQVPLVGVVAAGSLTEAIDNNLGVLAFSSHLIPQKKSAKFFALRVQGDSMIEAGIFEGDYVLVQSGAEIRSGDTVVARFRGEATVKDIFYKGKDVVLHPRNKALKDIIISAETKHELEILGKVVVVQRVIA